MKTSTTWKPGVIHQRGVRNNAAKLMDHEIVAIRKSKLPAMMLAGLYDVDQGTIRRIVTRKTWKHIAEDNIPCYDLCPTT